MTDNEAQRRRDELLDQSSRTEADLQELAKLDKIIRDAGVAAGTYDSRNRAASAQLAQSITRTIQSSADGAEGLTAYSDVVRSISNKIGVFVNNPLFVDEKTGSELESFAKAVGSVVIAIQKSGDAQFKAFRELSSSGLVMNMSDTFANLQGAGYTMAEMGKFTAIMKKNSTLFAALGGSAADGAKQFVDVAGSIRDSGLEEQYRNMGMSVDNINSSITQYMKLQLLSGSSKKQTTDEMREGVSALIDQQDRFAKLTGINAEEQNKANEQALGQEQYAANNAKLQATINAGGPEAEVAKKVMARNQELISTFAVRGKEQVGNLNKVLAGAVNDPGFQQFARAFPAATKAIQSGLTDSVEIMKIVQQDAAQTAKNRAHLAKQGLSDKEVGSFSAILGLSTYNADKMANTKDDIAKTQAQQKAGLMDASTANMAKMNQAQRDVNQDIDKIVNDAVPAMISGTDKLAGMTAQLSKMLGGINISELLSNLGGGAGGTSGSAGTAAPDGSTPVVSGEASENLGLVKQELQAQGITDDKLINATLGNVMKETEGKNVVEDIAGWGITPNLRIRSFFGSRVAGKTDAELDEIKKNPEAFAELVYGRETEMGRGMGNTSVGDGWKYRGRGFIGLTGKANYAAASQSLFGDDRLVQNPDLISSDPRMAAKMTAWYMKKNMRTSGYNAASTQADANLLATSAIYGSRVTRGSSNASMEENITKVDKYAAQIAAGQIRIKGASFGDILSGPIDGFMAMLHGTEAVIPMPDGKPIDVQSPGGEGSEEAESLMAMKMERMDTLLRGMTTYLRTTDRLLQLQS
jgi:predicted chitinase